MSITFVQEFHARPDRADELEAALSALLPGIRHADGCQSCDLYQSDDDPRRLLVFATWDSREAYEQAVRHIPTDGLRKTMTLVAEVPRGGVWSKRP